MQYALVTDAGVIIFIRTHDGNVWHSNRGWSGQRGLTRAYGPQIDHLHVLRGRLRDVPGSRGQPDSGSLSEHVASDERGANLRAGVACA